ncbi:hypothetical protein D3C80_1671850 [compost metagenome]
MHPCPFIFGQLVYRQLYAFILVVTCTIGYQKRANKSDRVYVTILLHRSPVLNRALLAAMGLNQLPNRIEGRLIMIDISGVTQLHNGVAENRRINMLGSSSPLAA